MSPFTTLIGPAPNRHGALETAFRLRCISCKWTHIVENVHPSLHGDALENSEDSKQDIVKVGDPKVGPGPVLLAGGAVGAGPCWSLQATGEICCQLIYRHNHTQKYTNMPRYF